MAPVLERFDSQLQGQRTLLGRFRFLSPAVLVQGAMNDLAGSGTERYEHFRLQADAFLNRWREIFARKVFVKRMMTPGDIATLSRFSFGILLPAAFLLAVGIRALRNYRLAA